MSSNFEANWDEANRGSDHQRTSRSAAGYGVRVHVGLDGGLHQEFFSGDKVMTQVAAWAQGQQVNLKIQENCIIAKGIKMYAQENNMTEDEVRGTVSLIAAAALQERQRISRGYRMLRRRFLPSLQSRIFSSWPSGESR